MVVGNKIPLYRNVRKRFTYKWWVFYILSRDLKLTIERYVQESATYVCAKPNPQLT